jgi:hypothetical protein
MLVISASSRGSFSWAHPEPVVQLPIWLLILSAIMDAGRRILIWNAYSSTIYHNLSQQGELLEPPAFLICLLAHSETAPFWNCCWVQAAPPPFFVLKPDCISQIKHGWR